MQLLLSFIFLIMAFVTGAHAYVFRNTLSHWLVSALSAFASVISSWTTVYFATRFFLDPSKIIVDAALFKFGMAFPNHPSSDIVVFGPLWMIPLFLPLLVACIGARELRKMPRMEPMADTPSAVA